MAEYVPTIGLEVHAELKTATKMFCRSKNDASETRPNVNICPVCMAHPGTLPVINKEAVKAVLRVGAALGGTLADYTEFDRKNYFYPDLPKGYQLSQYEFPLVQGGSLNGIAITRVHLEEDTASSSHNESTGETLIDYNRAGVPLMELVTEPVIHSAKEAGDFGRELQLLLRYLGVSDADMEKGNMRLEANVSVAPKGERSNVYVEIKNINSFGFMERAVAYEIKRQTEALERGETLVRETRGWDDRRQQTFSQRLKEGSADYRYFPDPDLPSLKLSELPDFTLETVKASLPELPADRRKRYEAAGVKAADAAQFAAYPYLGGFLDEVVKGETDAALIQRAANYVANDLVNLIRDTKTRDTVNQPEIAEMSNISVSISAENFKKVMTMLGEGTLSSRAGKDLLAHTIKNKDLRDPKVIAAEMGLLQGADAADKVHAEVARITVEHASVVADYKAGKEAALQFLIGQGMKALKGAANPAQLRDILVAEISKR